MTPYLWLNLLILILADIAVCGAMYLTYEALTNREHWLNGKDDPKRRW